MQTNDGTISRYLSAGLAFAIWSAGLCGVAIATEPNPPILHDGEGRAAISLTQFGALGDGSQDDSAAVQKALNRCSTEGLTCKVPAGHTFLIKSPLFIWGGARLVGEGETGVLDFSVKNGRYLFNVGLSEQKKKAAPFTGSISGVKFKVSSGGPGRIIFFWRTQGAKITDNIFDVGPYAYSATSSGNDAAWLENVGNYIRKEILISGNRILATSENLGSEGIGLGWFDGAVIENNEVTGVGDDPIGIHFSKNIVIRNNTLKSVDGRIYIANCSSVEIAHNYHERIASLATGKFYTGIGLIYLGSESYDRTNLTAPTNIDIHDNVLKYPPGSIDQGAALYFWGPRNVTAERNKVINDSDAPKLNASYIIPAKFKQGWTDPDKKDPADTARVWKVTIADNQSEGAHPLPFRMTGECKDYPGPVRIERNRGSLFSYYCDTVVTTDNVLTASAAGP